MLILTYLYCKWKFKYVSVSPCSGFPYQKSVKGGADAMFCTYFYLRSFKQVGEKTLRVNRITVQFSELLKPFGSVSNTMMGKSSAWAIF